MSRLSALTVRGRAFLAAGLAAALCALLLGQSDLLRVGVFLLALPLVSLVAVLRTRYRLSVQRQVEPRRVSAGQPATVHLELSNLARLPTGLLLAEDRVPYVLGARPRFVVDRIPARWTRELDYTVRCDLRGAYPVGPLSLRLADPFGLVELSRSFRTTDLVVVTPEVVPLTAVRLRGEWSGSGDSRPRAVAAAGEEDATIRDYREGDDLRRVHWRATARYGELMVRREEQPWQSRCTVLLDNRSAGHVGRGPGSSFEWAVVVAASLGVHQLQRGYAVRLVTDEGSSAGGAWHDEAHGAGVGDGQLLDALAVVGTSQDASVGRYPTILSGAGGSPGMLVAVLGSLDPDEAALVAQLRHGTGVALAVVLDTASWAEGGRDRAGDRGAGNGGRHEATVLALRNAGWRVVGARRGDDLRELWQRLGERPAGLPLATSSAASSSGASSRAASSRAGDAA